MGGLGKGIKSFKEGVKPEDENKGQISSDSEEKTEDQ